MIKNQITDPKTGDSAKVTSTRQLVISPYARWGSGADETDEVRMDASTNTLQTIEYEHHEIHSGSSFTCFFQDTVTDTDNRTIVTFKTPSGTKYIHIVVSVSATAISVARIREAPTYTDDAGVTLAIHNRNRVGTPTGSIVLDTSQSPDTAGSATSYVHDTANPPAEDGTIIAEIPLGSATSPVKSVGGTTRGQQELVLKPATLYSFEIKSIDASDNTHWIELDWYEHSDRH